MAIGTNAFFRNCALFSLKMHLNSAIFLIILHYYSAICLCDDTGGIRGVGKVDKVYLDNTNMAYLLGGDATDVGNIRETFFYNQMRVVSDVISSRISDFEIDGKTFEVGGKNKGKKQLSDAKEGYVVKDDIEFGSVNIIPLWAFGLLY